MSSSSNVVVLKDKEIRVALVAHLASRSPEPIRIVEELSVDNGNAIADVVTCHQELHCYEIKGQTDKVRRVLIQSEFYSQSFPKLTLVTTENHLSWALDAMPDYWGILLVKFRAGRVVFRYVRKAKASSTLCKRKALLTLWKPELVDLAKSHSQIPLKKSYTRADMAEQISCNLSQKETLAGICSAIVSRALNRIYDESDMRGS